MLEKQIELSNECISEQSKLFESIEESLTGMLSSMEDTDVECTELIKEEPKFGSFMKRILLSYEKIHFDLPSSTFFEVICWCTVN